SDKIHVEHIQQTLFQIGFAISATTTLTETDVELLESHIDAMQVTLPAQTTFILPSGCTAASQAHVCRTVTRRAERRMVALLGEYPVPDICLRYLNRLSDYLFVFARRQNFQAGIEESKV
ncbi:MAG: cob(I)alamin adenosyltransferase, partial [Paraglaciecola sp.]